MRAREREAVDDDAGEITGGNYFLSLTLFSFSLLAPSSSSKHLQFPSSPTTKHNNRTALHIAAAEGNVPAIEILLAGGADSGPQDRWSATPLLEAVKSKRTAAIDVLLAHGAAARGLGIDENAVSGLLCSAAEAKDAELIALYIKAGAPCDAGDYDKRTALHLAAAEGNSSIVEALLRAGASSLVKDRWGATPLDEAKREGRRETVKLLETALKE